MKAETVSTLASREVLRTAMARNQIRLTDTLKEFSTGRHADVGLALGSDMGRLLDMRGLTTKLDGLKSTNAVVGQRLELVQASLTGVQSLLGGTPPDLKDGFIDAALLMRQNGSNPSVLVSDAKARLRSITDMLSVTANGAYVFSGTNSSTPPLDDYLSEPMGAARSAVIAAFTTEFGFPPDDPQVVNITPAQLETYLDGSFAALFEDPSWGMTFSGASDQLMTDKISRNEEINSSGSVNDSGFRKILYALTLSVDGGVERMNSETRQVLVNRVYSVASEASYELVHTQSVAGIAQERLARANERIEIQQTSVKRSIGEAEGVDSYEVADRLGLLMSRIEASYSVTGRLQQLTLLNYL